MIPSISSQQVIDCARTYLGKPYHPGGRGGANGMDCLDILLLVGIELEQIPDDVYSHIPPHTQGSLWKHLDSLWQYVDEIPIEDATIGCGYLFCHNPQQNDKPRHVGIISDKGIIGMSLLQSVGKVCEHSLNAWYSERIVKAWRYRGLITE